MSYSSKIGIRWPVATVAQFFPSSAWLSPLWLNEINWTPRLADTPPTPFTLWSLRFFLQMEKLFPQYHKSSTISFTLQNFIRLLVNPEIQQRTSSLRNQHENFHLPFFKSFGKKRKICYNYVLYFRIPPTLLFCIRNAACMRRFMAKVLHSFVMQNTRLRFVFSENTEIFCERWNRCKGTILFMNREKR